MQNENTTSTIEETIQTQHENVPKRKIVPFNIRYTVLAAFAAAFGILVGTYCSLIYAIIFILLITVVTALYCLIFRLNKTAIIIFALIGFLFCFYSKGEMNNINAKVDLECYYQGVITDVRHYDATTTVILEPVSCHINDKVRLTIAAREQLDLKCGDILGAMLELRVPRSKENEHSRDERLQCLEMGVSYLAYADSDQINYLGRHSCFMTPFWDARTAVIECFGSHLHGDDAALVSGMLLGQDDDFSIEARESFSKTGITHIFSVSGLHVGIIVLALNELMILIGIYRKPRWIIISIILFAYCALTAFAPSIVRASIMSFILLMGAAFGERYDPLSAIGVAAIVLLSINPFNLYDIGFQLSFVATVGIISFTDLFKFENKFLNWLVSSLCATLAAQLACLPIMVNNFGSVSLISPIANLVIVPIASILLVLSIPISIIAAAIPAVGSITIILKPLSQIVLGLTNALSQINFALLSVGLMGIIVVVGYYSLFICCTRFYAVRIKTRIITILTIIVLTVTSVFAFVAGNENIVKVAFLSVGDGDCTVITVDNECYVIDSGSGDYHQVGLSNRGYFALSDYLYGEGIKNINFILTHDDADHSGGIIRMMIQNDMKVDKFIYNPITCQDNLMLRQAMVKAGEVIECQSGNVLTTENGEGVFNFVYPYKDSVNRTNISLAVLFEYRGCRILFCGDNEIQDGKLLAKENIDSDIMLLPHHGKKSAYCQELIEAASPEIKIISTDDAIANYGADTYVTKYSGQINIFIDNNGKYIVKEIKNDQK